MLRAIGAAKSRHRSDVDQAKQTESDIAEAAEYLEHASHLALACLLLVCLPHPFVANFSPIVTDSLEKISSQ